MLFKKAVTVQFTFHLSKLDNRSITCLSVRKTLDVRCSYSLMIIIQYEPYYEAKNTCNAITGTT
jgi:hypothetical protein